MEAKTLGERRVRTDFNPANNGRVDRIKQLTAQLINECEALKHDQNNGEHIRLIATAQTSYETACMYAVKAATA